jgi:hypothetical protein
MHTTNYTNTLIAVAEDSTAECGIMPPEKEGNPSIASRIWRMISEHPYTYTSDDVIFTVWADRKEIPEGEREAARAEFFSKGQACLRASDLGKKYGWGIHHDARGRVALHGVESDRYRALAEDDGVTVVRAMRTSRR